MPVLVVSDPGDTIDTARAVGARHAPDHGVVVCHPTPVRGLAGLPRDILTAMAKRFDAPESINDPRLLWDTTGDWLAGEAIRDLVLLRAQLLDLRTARRLLTLTNRLGALRVWLITSGPELGDGVCWALESGSAQLASLDELCAAPPARRARARGREPFPRVPRADFVLFARMCRRQLSATQRARVGEAVAHGAHAAHHALGARGAADDRRFAEELFGDLLVTSGCPDEALARFRGAQIALFLDGLHATFDADHLRGLHVRYRLDIADTQRARSLRRYVSTRLACAGALALALHLPAAEMRQLDIEDLVVGQPAVMAIRREDLRATVPLCLRGAVLAHLLRRARQGAQACDPVFTTRDGSDRIPVMAMHAALSKVARFSALRLDLDAPHHGRTPMSWAVHVERLDTPCSTAA